MSNSLAVVVLNMMGLNRNYKAEEMQKYPYLGKIVQEMIIERTKFEILREKN